MPGRMHAQLFDLAGRHHDAILALMDDLDALATEHCDEGLPREAVRLHGSLWPFLQAYGRRDHRGSVDAEQAPEIRPWRPGDDG